MVSAGGWGGAGIQGHVVRGHENTLSTAPPPVLASLGSAQSPFTTSLQRARGSGLGQAWALAPLAHTLDVSPGPKDRQGAVLSGTVLSPCIFEGVPTGTDEAPLHWAVRKAGVRDPRSGYWATNLAPAEHNKPCVEDFLGGPVVRNLCFHCRGHGFNPRLGN